MSKNKIYLIGILVIAFFAYRSYINRNPIEKNVDEESQIIDHIEEVVTSGPLNPKSEYLDNTLENGSSPFDRLYGKGKYSNTKHSLLVNNQGNSDVIIFLFNLKSDKAIRNEYIQAGTSFEFTKVPESECYVKYYYGKDWNPTRITKNVVTGGFDNNEQFEVSDNPSDIFEFLREEKGNYIYYSNYTLTLETMVEYGNTMSEEKVSPTEFF